MPYLPSSQEWLTQSSLLLQARPSSARITTKYTIAPSTSSKTASSTSQPPPTVAPAPTARGTLILKTYDPVSGACLKYRTDKAAEVGRLIASLGRLGKVMAGKALDEESSPDATMTDAPPAEQATEASTPVPEVVPAKEPKKDGGGDAKGGGSKKKKKGRK